MHILVSDGKEGKRKNARSRCIKDNSEILKKKEDWRREGK
jgi:hypothetical protein